jgi:FkbM family methyltransferase
VTYLIPLPGRTDRLDIVEPNSTSVQRALRREGLAAYEPSTVTTLLTLFDRTANLAFFDAGANMVLYALPCAAIFDPEHVHAFEPTPETVEVMQNAVRANRLDIDVIACALGDTDTTAELHLSSVSDSSNSLVKGFKQSVGTVIVPVRRLDTHVDSTGVAPNVMKIDVETFEPAVLAGAIDTIATHRPYIVIEVLHRRGHDHGDEITEVMDPFGYHYYRLDEASTWRAEPRITGSRTGADRDWLLAPEPLDGDFGVSWDDWRSKLRACGPERNSRVPIGRSVLVALRRGGPTEVVATARRYVAALRRERGRTPN